MFSRLQVTKRGGNESQVKIQLIPFLDVQLQWYVYWAQYLYLANEGIVTLILVEITFIKFVE